MASAGAPLGNQNAKNAKRFQQALRRALARECGTVDDGLERVATSLAKAGMAGEPWAIKEIADREDGKSAQTTDMTLDAGSGLLGILAGLGKGKNP